jgi:antitoxin component HigA of HigAB toxin-antitoxin module
MPQCQVLLPFVKFVPFVVLSYSSASTASRLLRGERGLSANHIRNTAKALHIAPELLI